MKIATDPDLALTQRWLEQGRRLVLVTVDRLAGSGPREEGAVMAVSADHCTGTIGGGQLEWLAIAQARALLERGESASVRREIALGPEIGQCCGGKVTLEFAFADAQMIERLARQAQQRDLAAPHVYIFGAGHTGKALAQCLSHLPVNAVLVDSRREAMAVAVVGVENLLLALPESAVEAAPPRSAFVAMTHEHSLDFLIMAQALAREDAAWCGMIGSKTKRAVFVSWLRDNGYDPGLAEALTCPIGGKLKDKRPEVIAALTAAEILAAVLTMPDQLIV